MDPTLLNFNVYDAFADAEAAGQQQSSGTAAMTHQKVHMRCQQRSGRKCITTVQGLALPKADLKRLLKDIKKRFNCNGSIQVDDAGACVLQMSGDQREGVRALLIGRKLVDDAADVVVHGA